jgi:hypothetical protein
MTTPARLRRSEARIADRRLASDTAAFMKLYDSTSATVYAYALSQTIDPAVAMRATRDAYVTMWNTPDMWADTTVPVLVRLTALTHLDYGVTSGLPCAFSRR